MAEEKKNPTATVDESKPTPKKRAPRKKAAEVAAAPATEPAVKKPRAPRKKVAPDGAAPDGAAPEGAATAAVASEVITAEVPAPEAATPETAAPDTAPTEKKPAARKPRAPRKKAAPDGVAPEGAAPDGAAPDGAAPEGTATAAVAPEVAAPVAKPAITPKKILFVGSEVMPFAATGGLGDVMGSLPAALRKKYGSDADVRVITPLYDSIPESVHAQMKEEAVFTVKLAWRHQYCGIKSLVKDGVTFYFVDNEYYFKRDKLYGHFDDGERYAYFCKAVLEMMPHLGYFPDVLHANDWQSAMSVVYLATQYHSRIGYENVKSVFTIHNIEYQGKYSFEILQDVFDVSPEHAPLMAYDGCINLMKAAIECAHRVTTVSPTYANEIMTPTYSHRLHYILARCSNKVSGILNGIDTVYYNPATDNDIAHHFDASTASEKVENKLAFQREYALPVDPDAPMIAVITRLAAHKGIDLITGVIRHVMDTHPNAQFVLLGTGDGEYEAFFRQLEQDYRTRARCFILYNRALSKKIYAAADLFLMPSRSEPCGLSQMIACRYGAIPVVRETGGLYDSIKPFYEDGEGLHGNGFTFANYNASELEERTCAALDLYTKPEKFAVLRQHAITSDFSWDASAEKYMEMYQSM